ncbi:unnamed protein product [Phytomonas sp. EM1]|nr:unnamed protein product [Phytomonas sp. EM1]|eukprot:CCW62517.1 unnamed protein product [Phytomonas sp. isolate EM1]
MHCTPNSRDDALSDLPRVKRKRTHLSQRERFLKELSKFASDSDNSHDEDTYLSAEQRLNQQGNNTITGNFFEQAAEEEERNHKSINRSDAPKRVGISLIKSMHTANRSSMVSRLDSGVNNKNNADTYDKEFKVVETYSPLSTGGFFETSMEPMDIRVVKIGDVMCLLSTSPGNSNSASLPKGSPSTKSLVLHKTEKSLTGVLSIQGARTGLRTAKVVNNNILNSPSAAKIRSFDDIGEVAATTRACTLLQRFRAEAKLTDEERTYGKKASVEMMNQLFEVTRLDRDNHTLEGLFLNGSRRVLRAHEVRLAGFIERKLYKKWKDDPGSQPVHTIEVVELKTQISPTCKISQQPGVAVEDSRAATVHAEGRTDSDKPGGITGVEGSPVAWWVIPNLIVRIVADNAGGWYGKKCVVRAIDRKSNKVRLISLELWLQHQQHSPQSPQPTSLVPKGEEVVEVVGLQGLETVLPKKGESGLVVLGPRRGEMASVVTRLCDSEGNLVKLKVQCNRTKDVFELEPHELCLLAPRQR